MGQREAIAFGEGVATTMRMKFETLKPNELPGRPQEVADAAAHPGEIDLHALIQGLRGEGPAYMPDDFGPMIGDDPFERLAAALDSPPPRSIRRPNDDEALRRLYED
jgi:uncharacterized protein